MRTALIVCMLSAVPAAGQELCEEDPKLARTLLPCARAVAPPDAPAATLARPAPPSARRRVFGVAFEAGIPDIFGASAVARPWRWMRVSAGLGTNAASVGVRGGVTIIPLGGRISPSLTLEGGHMFRGGSDVVRGLLSRKSYTVDELAYGYLNLHAGLEVGRPARWVFYLHAGVSYVAMQLYGRRTSDVNQASVTMSDPLVRSWLLSGKLGFVVYL